MNNIGVIQLRRPVTPQTGRATYYFNQALKLDEDDPDYYFNLGYAYWAEKDAQSAIFWLREAVRRDPADGEAHAVLAAALQATGAAAEAARERELATQLSSTYAEWAKKPAGGRSRFRAGSSGSSPRWRYRRSAASTTRSPWRGSASRRNWRPFISIAGGGCSSRGATPKPITELARAIYLSPYEAEAHLLLGRIYLRTGQTAAAIDAFKIALWSQESVEGRIALAQAYLQMKDPAGCARGAASARWSSIRIPPKPRSYSVKLGP